MPPRVLRFAWIAAFAACSAPPPAPPAAVINATPSSVCIGDAFHTQVHLDSRGSSPALTLVYSAPSADAGALKYDWSFSGAVCKGVSADPAACDVNIDSSGVEPDGRVDGTDVLLTMAGDRPVFVTFRVTNAVGGVTETHAVIPLTLLDDAGSCPLTQGP